MTDDSTTQRWLFPDLAERPVVAVFDQARGSSDAGAVLLKAADRRLGLTNALAECLLDARDPERITHDLRELVEQRVYAIACGYADCNDAERIGCDPVFKLLLERDPLKGRDLASQPTLSRFENSVGQRDLVRMGEKLADQVVERHKRRLGRKARLITIDLDQTEDPTHGAQQLALFNGYYGNWCYIPLLGFLTFNDEEEQYLAAAVLRPGNVPDTVGSLGILRRLVVKLRKAFPKAQLRVRLDAGFSGTEFLDFCDMEGVEYVIGIAKNKVLEARVKEGLEQARELSARSGETERVYGEASYAAKSWVVERRIIMKAEVTRHPGRDPKDNPRFVVTNLPQTPRWIYERIYCQRGDVENRIKELHHGLEIDRTSCSRFLANQFRVLLTATAYVLMQELRLRAAGTTLARAQVWTLRDRLLKVGTSVVTSVRRIVLQLPSSFASLEAWALIARRLGAHPI